MSRKTVLVIGAHMDDCELGAGGLIAKAVKKGHRVVLVNCASDYATWRVTRGWEKEVKERVLKKAAEMGVEKRFLGYAYQQVPRAQEAIRKLAEIVVDVRPDVTLFHNQYDRGPSDHATVAYIAERAVRDARCLLTTDVSFSGEMYAFEVAPRFSEFQPDMFIDIGDVFAEVVQWPNYFDELYAEATRRPGNEHLLKESWLRSCAEGPRMKLWVSALGEQPISLSSHGEGKLATAIFRGFQCGAKFAEAYMAVGKMVAGWGVLQEIGKRI